MLLSERGGITGSVDDAHQGGSEKCHEFAIVFNRT